jgi:hypothetical protein
MNKLFLMALTIISMSLITSCEEDVITLANDTQTEENKEFLFSKDVLIQLGNTQATMRVHANTELELEGYTARNFQLVEVKADESLTNALVSNKTVDLNEENLDETQEPTMHTEEPVASSLAFELVQIENKNAGSHYAVSFLHPGDNARASWQYFTHYSSAVQNLEPNASIIRHSALRRVYFGATYRSSSTANWSTLQSEWRKLSNNQTVSYSKTPCYQYRITVKTKKSSAYSVSFY